MPSQNLSSRIAVLNVETYFVDGRPTCAINFDEGKVCMFHRTSHFGMVESCAITGKTLDRSVKNVDREEDDSDCIGFLIPCNGCIVHNI